MTDPDLINLFIRPLDALDIPYMVTGGVASVIYGDPRFTRDIDVVLGLTAKDIVALIRGFDPRDFYVPPVEALQEEAARTTGGHFSLIHRETALRADVYVAGQDELHSWAMHHRRRIDAGDMGLWVAPVEYVILRKLEHYRVSGSDRHLQDVAMILRISSDLLDLAVLGQWAEERGLTSLLEAVRGTTRPERRAELPASSYPFPSLTGRPLCADS